MVLGEVRFFLPWTRQAEALGEDSFVATIAQGSIH